MFLWYNRDNKKIYKNENVKYEDDVLIVESNNEEDLTNVVIKYFDLERDYSNINNVLNGITMKKII